MTSKQTKLFWILWAEACEVQGWMGNDRELQRKNVLAELGWKSLKDVTRTNEFDRLKGHLLRLSYRIPGGTEAAFPDVGEMRRHCGLIRADLLPRLAAVHPDPEGYVGRILRDRFGGVRRWEDLAENPMHGPRLIRQLLYTLTRAVRRLEKLADRGASLDNPLKTTLPEGPSGQIVAQGEPAMAGPA